MTLCLRERCESHVQLNQSNSVKCLIEVIGVASEAQTYYNGALWRPQQGLSSPFFWRTPVFGVCMGLIFLFLYCLECSPSDKLIEF